MMIIGLTGGVGAGKDEAAKILKSLGVKIIDADDVGHRLLEKNRVLQKRLVKTFGCGILSKGKIARKKLGEIVFGNRGRIRLLNQAIHPLMGREFRKKIAGYKKKGVKAVVLNAAILFEAGWDKFTDKTILVTAPLQMRIKRLKKKRINRKKALAMISSQWSDERKNKKADFIIKNNSSLTNLKKKITDTWQLIKD